MTFIFEHHLKALVYLHLQEYESGRELLQVLEQDDFARTHIAPPEGVSRSTFFEAMNTRALEQLSQMYHLLQNQAKKLLPALHPHLGDLIAIDGSLINAVPTMQFADYRDGTRSPPPKGLLQQRESRSYSVALSATGRHGECGTHCFCKFFGVAVEPGHHSVVTNAVESIGGSDGVITLRTGVITANRPFLDGTVLCRIVRRQECL